MDMPVLCCDKTGNLTLNKVCGKWNEPPGDALGPLVLDTSGQELTKCKVYKQLEFTPFDPRMKFTQASSNQILSLLLSLLALLVQKYRY
jgi:hypothetical protein